MLWLQIASQTAVALLALVARIQTYGNFSTSYTVALLLDAAWPHLLFIADDVTHSYIKSNFLLAAPPARYSLPAAPTIPSSKDLLQWMHTPDVYESLHIPSLTATSITRPSTVTATSNSTTSSMRLEYPTKDIVIREELINPAASILTYLVAYGTFTIAIACCSVYLVLKRHQRGRILQSVNVEAKSEDNTSALPPFIEELILNGRNASTDNIPHAPRQKSNLSTFWTVESHETPYDANELQSTDAVPLVISTGISADRTALYPDAVPQSERGGIANTFDTQAAQTAQTSLEHASADPHLDSTDMETTTNNVYETTPLEGDHVPMDLSLSTDVGTRIHDVNHAAGNPCHDQDLSTMLPLSSLGSRPSSPSPHVLDTLQSSPTEGVHEEGKKQPAARSDELNRPAMSSAVGLLQVERLSAEWPTQLDDLARSNSTVDHWYAQLDAIQAQMEEGDAYLEVWRVQGAEVEAEYKRLAEEHGNELPQQTGSACEEDENLQEAETDSREGRAPSGDAEDEMRQVSPYEQGGHGTDDGHSEQPLQDERVYRSAPIETIQAEQEQQHEYGARGTQDAESSPTEMKVETANHEFASVFEADDSNGDIHFRPFTFPPPQRSSRLRNVQPPASWLGPLSHGQPSSNNMHSQMTRPQDIIYEARPMVVAFNPMCMRRRRSSLPSTKRDFRDLKQYPMPGPKPVLVVVNGKRDLYLVPQCLEDLPRMSHLPMPKVPPRVLKQDPKGKRVPSPPSPQASEAPSRPTRHAGAPGSSHRREGAARLFSRLTHGVLPRRG